MTKKNNKSSENDQIISLLGFLIPFKANKQNKKHHLKSLLASNILLRWLFFAVQVGIRLVCPRRIGKRSDWWPDSAHWRIQNSSAAWLSVSGWPGWSYKCPYTHKEGSEARRDTPAWAPQSWETGYWGCSSYWGYWGWIPARRWPPMAPCRKSWRIWSWAVRTSSARIKGWHSLSWRRGSFWWIKRRTWGLWRPSCCTCSWGTCRRRAAWVH